MIAATFRLLPYAIADGARNMAADETLLESAASGVPSLRFYGWTEPTLSLGYFQPAALRRADSRLLVLPWLRRPTGGEALVHHHELTYALALPVEAEWQPRGLSWTAHLHQIVAAALASLGVHLTPATKDVKRDPLLCFLHSTPGDLLLQSAKVVGSAQRKRRGALLQHGSILLAGSPHTPSLPGIAELTGKRLLPSVVAEAVVVELGRQLGWSIVGAAWTAAELARMEELVNSRYASPAWNNKR